MQQISTERVYDEAQLGELGDPLGIVQGIEVWPYEKIGYSQPRIYPREWEAQIPLGFWHTNGLPNLG